MNLYILLFTLLGLYTNINLLNSMEKKQGITKEDLLRFCNKLENEFPETPDRFLKTLFVKLEPAFCIKHNLPQKNFIDSLFETFGFSKQEELEDAENGVIYSPAFTFINKRIDKLISPDNLDQKQKDFVLKLKEQSYNFMINQFSFEKKPLPSSPPDMKKYITATNFNKALAIYLALTAKSITEDTYKKYASQTQTEPSIHVQQQLVKKSIGDIFNKIVENNPGSLTYLVDDSFENKFYEMMHGLEPNSML